MSLVQCDKQYKTEDKNPKEKPEMVVHVFNPSFWEGDIASQISELIDQTWLYRETLSQKTEPEQ